jgi:hypothetical protein
VPCPPPAQVINAELDYKFACTNYDVRLFVIEALESMNLGPNMAAAKADLMSALDEAERASGGELVAGNDKGWQVRGLGGWGWPVGGVAWATKCCRDCRLHNKHGPCPCCFLAGAD